MSTRGTIAILALSWSVTALAAGRAGAVDLRTDLMLLNQVREGDQSRETEAPAYIYGDLSVSGLRHGTTVETYFGLGHDLATGDGLGTNFYAGAMRVPGAIPGVDFTLGRQFLAETPGGVFVADAGKVRVDLGGPVALTVFGGQPRYFEPLYSTEQLSQDEQIFGGSIRTTHLKDGYLSVGYLQQERDQRELRQLITGTGAHTFAHLPGRPNVYSSFAYDADHQNVDQVAAGVQTFLLSPRLSFNFESGYYKPQDQGEHVTANLQRREDPIFQLFSISNLLQFRGGLRFAFNRSLSSYADYSYQRYEKLDNLFENGHVGSVGLLWLPGGDGLEVVRMEYYTVDSSGGQVNGGKVSYVSQVYDRILFRIKGDVSYYEKESNQADTAVSTLLGIGYALLPGLVCEVDMEANRNKRFNDEFRFDFRLTYSRRDHFNRSESHRTGEPS